MIYIYKNYFNINFEAYDLLFVVRDTGPAWIFNDLFEVKFCVSIFACKRCLFLATVNEYT